MNKMKTWANFMKNESQRNVLLQVKKDLNDDIDEQIYQLEHIKQESINKPKSWFSRKIADLRSLYFNYQQKANEEKATGQAGIFTKIASAILNCIDWLMEKLQNIL